MKNLKNIILMGNISLLLIIATVNIFNFGIGDIYKQTSINDNDSETNSSQITQFTLYTQISHVPIVIDGNDDFSSQAISEGWTGNGSITNPYCIVNYSISTTGGSGIMISNTDVYFVIENVTITGATSNTGAFNIFNVVHGKLINNTAKNSYYGFLLGQSSNITFDDNTASSNSRDGFYQYLSNDIFLNENIAINNSRYGFYLYISDNNNVFTSNIAKDNDNNGFHIVDSNFNTFTGNNYATNNFVGFDLSNSNNNTFIGNNATDNTVVGFDLANSNNNTFTGNNATDNYFGYNFYSSSNNTLNSNFITYNSQYGVHMIENSTDNSIYLNIFIENNNGYTQAYSSNLNYWNNGTHGNLWSDYAGIDSDEDGIGDTSYLIDGDGAETDSYPLMSLDGYNIPEFNPILLLMSLFFGFISLGILFNKNK